MRTGAGKRALFVDTSAWYEAVVEGAPRHAEVATWVKSGEATLVTTTYVLSELATLLARRFGHGPAKTVGGTLRSSPEVRIVHPSPETERRAWDLFCARPDKGYSFCDCVSFVVMKELGITAALATDRHFAQEGFLVVP